MVYKRKYHDTVYYGPAVIFALVIFIMSSLPGDSLPEVGIDLGDKFIHMIEFGLFGIFLYRAFLHSPRFSHPYIVSVCVGIPYAALDEIHQFFVEGRYCEIGDFTADVIGIFVFAGISAFLNLQKKRANK